MTIHEHVRIRALKKYDDNVSVGVPHAVAVRLAAETIEISESALRAWLWKRSLTGQIDPLRRRDGASNAIIPD